MDWIACGREQGRRAVAAECEIFRGFGKMKPESEEDEWVALQAENICLKKKKD